jgi:hypothetical protein
MLLLLLAGLTASYTETRDYHPDYPSPLSRFAGSVRLVFISVTQFLGKILSSTFGPIFAVLRHIRIELYRAIVSVVVAWNRFFVTGLTRYSTVI